MDSGTNIHVCADISLFTSYHAGMTGAMLMGNGAHASVLGVGRGGTSGYGNSLHFVLSVCLSPEWWMDSGANIHVC